MITYASEGATEPLTLTTPTGEHCTVQCWPTRVPGLVVAGRLTCDCGEAEHCFALYSPATAAFVGPCFPLKICAAAFATFLVDVAPWSGEAATINAAVQEANWTDLQRAGAALGGKAYPHATRNQQTA